MKRAFILSGGGTRGAFQVGVIKFLEEIGWKPDLICGTSIGAINAIAMGSGMNHEQLTQLWQHIERRHIFRLTLKRFLMSFMNRRTFHPLFDTTPLKGMLERYIDFNALRKSEAEILISAANLLTCEVKYFNHHVISVEHLMAATAIPGVFAWQYINGEPYWDGGIMVNVPIMPAIDRGCETIVVVILSPIGYTKLPLPHTHEAVLDRILDHALVGSYSAVMSQPSWQKNHQILTISPKWMPGVGSFLNVSHQQVHRLIWDGYEAAKLTMSGISKSA